MKYTILINQYGIVKAGLHKKTDLVDWAIIDYLKDWYFVAPYISLPEGRYALLDHKRLIENMPLLSFGNADEIKSRIEKLENLSLIETYCLENKTYYVVNDPTAFSSTKLTCPLCGRETDVLHRHHIVPRRLGGTNKKDNLIKVCPTCHTKIHYPKGGGRP